MRTEAVNSNERIMPFIFKRALSLWVPLCISGGILSDKIAIGVAQTMDGMILAGLSDIAVDKTYLFRDDFPII